MRKLMAMSVGALAVGSARGAAPELRGVWLTTTGYSATSTSYPLSTAAVTNQTFATLRGIGLNSTYMDAWRDGYTWFASPTLAAIPGETRDRHPSEGTRDLFQDTLLQAHRNGMAQIAWFQYGFATQFKTAATNPLTTYMMQQGWLLKDSAGAYTDGTNSYYWMNPLVPQVQQFIKGIVLDAVNKYDLDGIQFDDRLAWPVQFGYDDYTKNLYKQETGRDVPADATDAQFVAWRAGKLTDFVKSLYVDVKSRNPNLIVSVAPTLYNYSYTNYCVDWPAWSKTSVVVNGVTRPLFDEYVPQVYSSNVPYFQSSWNTQVANMGTGRVGQLGAGISADGSSGVYDWSTVSLPQVNYERSTAGAEGQVWWYANSVLGADAGNLTAYYNVAGTGQAARTDQPANWRAIDLAATSIGSSQYTVNVGTEGFYEIVTHVGSTYALYGVQDLLAGMNTLTVPGAYTGVEVLIDRRPYNIIPGVVKGWGGGSGDWGTAGNWSGGVANGVGLEAQFVGAAGGTVNLGNAVGLGSVVFDSAGSYVVQGAGALTVGRASRGGAIVVNQGQQRIGVPVVLARDTVVSVAVGAGLTVGGMTSGTSVLTKAGAGVLRLTADVTLSGGLVVSGGAVDLGGTTLVVTGATNVVRGYLGAGGIVSSAKQAVGYLVNGDGTVTLRGTYAGDANLDGGLDGDDYALLDRGYAQGGMVWAEGDFNYDGMVNGQDYLRIDGAYLSLHPERETAGFLAEREARFGAGYVAELVAAVPEPSLVGVVLVAMVGGRKRLR